MTALILHAMASAQDYYISSGGKILLIDPTTCTETVLCNNIPVNTGGGTTSGNIGDIAFHPNGNLYGLVSNYFIEIDLATCTSTTLSNHSTGSNSLVADASGNLYAANDSLYLVDEVTGVFTALGELPCTSGGDLAFHGGKLYMTCMSGDLLEVNISNPSSSIILGNLGTGSWYGLWTAYVDCNNSVLLAGNENDIYEVDLATVTTTFNCSLGTWTWVEGATMIDDYLASDCGCPVNLGSDTTFCSGNLTLDATGTNYTYTWSTGASSPTINISGPGTYYVDITETVTGCMNSDTIVVTTGTSANAGTDYSISLCGGSSTFDLLDSIPGSPDAGGTWSGPSALSGGDQGSFTTGSNADGTYAYVVLGSGGCPNDTALVTVTNNTTPNAGNDLSMTYCAGDSPINLYDIITGSPDIGGTWSGPSALTGGYQGTLDPSTATAGIYYYIVGSAACGLDSAEVTISIDALPVYNWPNDTSLCENDLYTITLPGGNTYDWDFGTSSANSYDITHPTVGTYMHYVAVTNGQCTSVDSIAITVINCATTVTASVSGATSICEDSCSVQTVTVSVGQSPYDYLWSDGTTGTDVHTLCPTTSTNYYVVVTDANMNVDTVFFSIIVNPHPIITTSNDTTIALGGVAYLDAMGASTYVWSPASDLSCSNCSSPDATPFQTTSYTVVGTSNGCSSTASVLVTVEFNSEIFIPTAFSPNGDGLNDTYGVISSAFKSANFRVFDRWGSVVFETTDLSIKWDGDIKGEPAQVGAYHYMLTGVMHNNEMVELSGNTSLVR